MKKWLLAGAGAAVAAIGLWFGVSSWPGAEPAPQSSVKPLGDSALDTPQPGVDIVTVAAPEDVARAQGATPMGQRVAVLGLLNKRNGVSRDVTLKPGEATRLGQVVIRLKACEQTAPWEQEHFTGGFVQVEVEQADKKWRRVFSGWLFKERPALNVVQHPIYDVWVKSCAMTFPSGGDSVVTISDAPTRSSAKKSPAAEPAPAAEAAPGAPATAPSTAPAIAADNRPT